MSKALAFSLDEESFQEGTESVYETLGMAVDEWLAEHYDPNGESSPKLYIGERMDPKAELARRKRSILGDLVERINENDLEEHCFEDDCLVIPGSAQNEAAEELLAVLLKHGVFRTWAVDEVTEYQTCIELDPDGDNCHWAAYLGKDEDWTKCLPAFWNHCPMRSLLIEERDGKCIARSGAVYVEWDNLLEAVLRLAEICEKSDARGAHATT